MRDQNKRVFRAKTAGRELLELVCNQVSWASAATGVASTIKYTIYFMIKASLQDEKDAAWRHRTT